LRVHVLWSKLAIAQLEEISPRAGQAILKAVERLYIFPESCPTVRPEGYEEYRELHKAGYRLVYRHFPEEALIRIYCVQHHRRLLPPIEYLEHLQF
jgi:plasmid stabilization system protein ParE